MSPAMNAIRTPQQIIDALAVQRGLVTPVPPYFPVGMSFTKECVREAYRDVMDALAEAARGAAGKPAVVEALMAVFEQVAERVKETGRHAR
jgi:hypothetical protein